MLGHRSAVAKGAILGFAIVACVIACRSAHATQPRSGERTPSGIGLRIGPLFFDPEGADFTAWINHFKNEVYHNWIVPKKVLTGSRGHVDIEFMLERDGRLSKLKLLTGSGTAALDHAAQNALKASRFLGLPRDFGPPRVTMQVTFFYNETPQTH